MSIFEEYGAFKDDIGILMFYKNTTVLNKNTTVVSKFI